MKLRAFVFRIAATFFLALASAGCTLRPSRLPADAPVTFTPGHGAPAIALPPAAARRVVSIVNSPPTRTDVDQITYYGGGHFEVEGREYHCNSIGIYYIRQVLRSAVVFYWEDDPAIARMHIILTRNPGRDLTPEEVIEELER